MHPAHVKSYKNSWGILGLFPAISILPKTKTRVDASSVREFVCCRLHSVFVLFIMCVSDHVLQFLNTLSYKPLVETSPNLQLRCSETKVIGF